MARLGFGILLFTAVFAQATVVPAVNPFTVSPDIVLMLLFAASMYMGVREGLSWLFVAGIVTDVLAMDPLGSNGLALLPAVLLVGPARRPVFRANILIPLGLMLIATVIHALLLCLIRGIMPDIAIVLQTLMHAIMFPFLYFALRWLE
jgi:rod shape-determining protein MreD